MSCSIALMMMTGSLHPPACGAVMVVMDSAAWQSMGYAFVLYPAVIGSLFIVFMGRITMCLKKKFEFNLGGGGDVKIA